MKYAIDKRKNKVVVVNKETRRDVSPLYSENKEYLALKWIKIATKFPYDISRLEVERLYEKRLEEKFEEELTTIPEVNETIIMGDMDNPLPEPLVIEEPEEELIPWEPMYFCKECNRNHEKTSKIGRNHLKYREVN